MKNRTVIILINGQCEYDDYTETVKHTYIVRRKPFNLESEYAKFIYSKLPNEIKNNCELRVEKTRGTYIFFSKITVKLRKALNVTYKTNSIKSFVENECKGEKIDFIDYVTII